MVGINICAKLREATRKKKQLDFGFLLKGEGGEVLPESKAFEDLFKEPLFHLEFGHF